MKGGTPELLDTRVSSSPGHYSQRGGRDRLQDQEAGELPCHNLAAQNTTKTCILNTDEPSTGGGNYSTNIFLMQNRTNDTYLHDANKVLKNLSFGDTIVIMWFQ